jgi:NAD(P)H-flavin reductase
MTSWSSHLCCDAGSEFCPCYLAEVARCVNCSLLSGQDCCECAWSGSCIFTEYLWNGSSARPLRGALECRLVDRVEVGKDAFVLVLSLPSWLGRSLRAPSSFVFLRPANRPHIFDVPLSVMQVRDGGSELHLAVQDVGPKTAALGAETAAFSCRGPYYSGMIGLESLKIPARNALIVAKGISQGRGAHVACHLRRRGTSVTLACGPGPVGAVFAGRWLDTDGIDLVELPRRPDHSRQDITRVVLSKPWDLVVSAGPDVQHQMVQQILASNLPGARRAYTNNTLMCCGEGICGTCYSCVGDKTVKLCKAMPAASASSFPGGGAGV